MKERCYMFEIGPCPEDRPFKPWKFKSRLVYRVEWAWFAFCIIKMSFYDYDKEVSSGKTQWVK